MGNQVVDAFFWHEKVQEYLEHSRRAPVGKKGMRPPWANIGFRFLLHIHKKESIRKE